jgi:hypothetical protein
MILVLCNLHVQRLLEKSVPIRYGLLQLHVSVTFY